MNKERFAAHLGLEVRTVEFWLEQEWLVPARTVADVRFSDADVARGRLIQDLGGGFGVNDEGIDVVLHLLDQLHGVRRAFAELQANLERTSRETGTADSAPGEC